MSVENLSSQILELCLRSARGSTTTDEDHTHEEEDNDRRELQDRDPELFFGVSHDTEQADNADGDEEYNDPDRDVYLLSPRPPLDRKTGNNEFERKNNSLYDMLDGVLHRAAWNNYPLEDVVPTHCKAPGRIDKADRVGVKTTGDWVQHSHLTKSVNNIEHHLHEC